MGTVLAIANQKGGVGKTTTAVNLGASIADAGYPTLLVDLDPQCNATVALGLPKDGAPNVYDCISGDLTLGAAAIPSGVERLDVVPSTPELAGANVELPRVPGSETLLRGRVGSVRDRYLFTLFDCPPSLGPLTVNALVAADRVIVPVQTEYFALEGLAQLLDTLSLIRRELNPRLTVAGMILTMHDGRTRLARDVEREVREHFPELVFDTVVPRNVRLSEAPSFGLPVLAPRSPERRLGGLPQARQGGGRAWLSPVGAWAAGWRPSCRAPATGEEGLRELPLELVRPNPRQPRRSFDESALAELAESIRARGLVAADRRAPTPGRRVRAPGRRAAPAGRPPRRAGDDSRHGPLGRATPSASISPWPRTWPGSTSTRSRRRGRARCSWTISASPRRRWAAAWAAAAWRSRISSAFSTSRRRPWS